MDEQKSLLEKIATIDRRYLYILIFIAITIPILYPLGLPIRISQETKDTFELIDTIPTGATITMSFETDAPGLPELEPQFIAIAKHLKEKGVKIVAVSWQIDGGIFSDRALQQVFGTTWEEDYGNKFVNLGYIAGLETGMAAFASNVQMITIDHYNNPTSDMEILRDLTDVSDFHTMIVFPWTIGQAERPLRQFVAPGYTTVIEGVTSLVYPTVTPYIESGDISGVLAGLSGAAEYELLIGKPGEAIKGLDAQSLAHIIIIVFIVIGNIELFATSRKKEVKI